MKLFGKTLIGYQTPKFEVEVEKGRLMLFSKAIGETSPMYVDEAVAVSHGYRSLLVPPTFLFCLEMERTDPYDWFSELEIPLANVLHAGQSFTYHDTACAGDVLQFSGEIVDTYSKKNDELQFIVHRNYVRYLDGRAVAEFDRTIVVQAREEEN
jgi:hypothetical protein